MVFLYIILFVSVCMATRAGLDGYKKWKVNKRFDSKYKPPTFYNEVILNSLFYFFMWPVALLAMIVVNIIRIF